MILNRLMKSLTALFLVAGFGITASAEGESGDQMAKIMAMLEAQQAEIAELKAQLDEATGEDEGVTMTTNTPQGADAVGAGGSRWSPMSNKRKARAASWAERTSIGGYGELHSNHTNGKDGSTSDTDKTDFHRLVLFVGHEFNSWSRFASEIEFEHSWAGDGREGDVVVELAWLELDINANHHFRAGADILPVGIMNLTHEPTTFYGVERNMVEAEIIPSTWTEAGAGFWGQVAPGLNYNLFAHTGLKVPTSGSSAMRVRSGRQKVANGKNQDIAILGRLTYTAVPGLELAFTVDYQNDYTGTSDAIEASAYLIETHIDYKHSSGLGLRALYARWDFGKDSSQSFDPGLWGASEVEGWYVEPAYRFDLGAGIPGELGLFVRYEEFDERDGGSATGAIKKYVKHEMFSVGANWWPTPNIVFKIDGQFEDAPTSKNGTQTGVNLGLGFQF